MSSRIDSAIYDSRQSRTYKGRRSDGTGVGLYIRGSDDEPRGHICNGRP